MIRVVLLALLLAGSGVAPAAYPIEFQSDAEQARYRELLHQLRCVMCQNQSLADSPAEIAGDLRRQVIELMREGHSDEEIREFLVARYGEFVLYRPPLGPATWLLWFGPLLIVLAGTFVVVRTVRRKSADAAKAPPPEPGEDEDR